MATRWGISPGYFRPGTPAGRQVGRFSYHQSPSFQPAKALMVKPVASLGPRHADRQAHRIIPSRGVCGVSGRALLVSGRPSCRFRRYRAMGGQRIYAATDGGYSVYVGTSALFQKNCITCAPGYTWPGQLRVAHVRYQSHRGSLAEPPRFDRRRSCVRGSALRPVPSRPCGPLACSIAANSEKDQVAQPGWHSGEARIFPGCCGAIRTEKPWKASRCGQLCCCLHFPASDQSIDRVARFDRGGFVINALNR
jgi:hypothetical protein